MMSGKKTPTAKDVSQIYHEIATLEADLVQAQENLDGTRAVLATKQITRDEIARQLKEKRSAADGVQDRYVRDCQKRTSG